MQKDSDIPGSDDDWQWTPYEMYDAIRSPRLRDGCPLTGKPRRDPSEHTTRRMRIDDKNKEGFSGRARMAYDWCRANGHEHGSRVRRFLARFVKSVTRLCWLS